MTFEDQVLIHLQTLINLGIWICRLLSISVGVAVFRFVSLRSTI